MKLLNNSIKPIKNNLEDDEKELDGVEFEFSNKNRDKDLVQHLELSDIGNSNRYEQLQQYSFDGEDSFEKMTGIKFIIICIKDTQNDTVTAGFQTFSKSQILSVDDRVLLSKFSQTLANDEEPTYSSDFSDALYDIPQRIDVLYHDGELYVFNQSRFERIFGHYDDFEDAAKSIVDNLDDKTDVEIEGMSHFNKAIDDFPNVKRRLYDVKKNIDQASDDKNSKPIYEALNQDNLEYLKDNFDSDVIVVDNKEYKIQLENRFDSWGLIKVLNDAHLESELTNSGYVTNSKNRT
jgi:uncharacterized protein YdcH (DUF465 family)